MKVSRIVVLLIFITSTVISQNQPLPVVKNSEIKKYAVEEGVHDVGFKMTDNTIWNMKLSIPKIEKGKTYPLVLALHWAGDNDTYKEFSSCLAFNATSSLNAIVVAPSSNSRHWIDPMNEKRVIDLVRKIKKHWPVDEDKIIVTGYSNGGIGSWQYAIRYPKLFSAAVAIAGYYEAAKIKIPVYVLHGSEDEFFDKTWVTNAIKNSRKKGSKIDFRILPKLSHYMACYYADALKLEFEKLKLELWQDASD